MAKFILILALLLVPAIARANNIDVRLIAETTRPAAGQSVALAFEMTPKPGWHGYWQNPGDAGVEMRVAWTLPGGVTAGPLAYPVPDRLIIGGIMNYVFEGRHTMMLDLAIPPGLAAGTRLPIKARLDYLVCTNEICVPESATVETGLTVGDGAIAAADRARFDGYRSALPRPLGGKARFERRGDAYRMAVPLPSSIPVKDAYFFPLTDGTVDHSAPQRLSRKGNMLIVETKAAASSPTLVQGVLRIDADGGHYGLKLTAKPGPVPGGGEPLGAEAKSGGLLTFLVAFGGAMLGGLILNIMPCVFPILSLKALSLAKSGETQAHARHEALSYTAGAVLTALALGGALLLIRAGGEAVGWAFQLQNPKIITALLLLVTALALNLSGVFELPSLGTRMQASGGFATGAMAAFVATPCTGPFMGAALGAALVLPTAAALAIFAGLGLGLSLPFLALGFIPALRRRLPRPGAWMEKFRRILSIPMWLTALGLAWILGRQAGVDGMTLGLAGALAAGLLLWWLGYRQSRGKGVTIAALGTVLAATLTVMLIQAGAPGPAQAAATAGQERFSEARLQALRAEGRPVFVYFTADWCLTCKVNEKSAIARVEVGEAFAKGHVATLVGDWTNADPEIGRFLEQHGRSGVPLYLFYAPGTESPTVLPQLLTPSMLVELAG